MLACRTRGIVAKLAPRRGNPGSAARLHSARLIGLVGDAPKVSIAVMVLLTRGEGSQANGGEQFEQGHGAPINC